VVKRRRKTISTDERIVEAKRSSIFGVTARETMTKKKEKHLTNISSAEY
jgi:hypothetical protein